MKSLQHGEFVLLSIVGVLSLWGYAHGHTFTSTEDASFLSLMDDLKSTISLIDTEKDNATLALVIEYANKASLLLNS